MIGRQGATWLVRQVIDLSSFKWDPPRLTPMSRPPQGHPVPVLPPHPVHLVLGPQPIQLLIEAIEGEAIRHFTRRGREARIVGVAGGKGPERGLVRIAVATEEKHGPLTGVVHEVRPDGDGPPGPVAQWRRQRDTYDHGLRRVGWRTGLGRVTLTRSGLAARGGCSAACHRQQDSHQGKDEDEGRWVSFRSRRLRRKTRSTTEGA